MIVQVTGRRYDGWTRRDWRLVAEAGHGPYVPGVAARLIERAADGITPGARPAIAEVPLAAIEASLSDLSVTTTAQSDAVQPLFLSQLRSDFHDLPDAVRESHDWVGCLRLEGRAELSRGRSLAAHLIATLFRFPPDGADVPLTVTKVQFSDGEIWLRDFNGCTFRSHLRSVDGRMSERFGPFTFILGLTVRNGTLAYPVVAGRIGPLPLPRMFLPVSNAAEREEVGRFHFDVELRARWVWGGLFVAVDGCRNVGRDPNTVSTRHANQTSILIQRPIRINFERISPVRK
jgi:hypothetical protein